MSVESPVFDREAEELVFRALCDPHRRMLLDLLLQRDGQTLGELDAHLPMTRFGTMKHLRTLEAAGLVRTRRQGRRKLHYLDPGPIRTVQSRWLSKYIGDADPAPPWRPVVPPEEGDPSDMTEPRHAYEVFIRATPERLWEAITNPELTRHYYYGTRVSSDWKPGAGLTYAAPDGSVAAEGTVLVVEPPRRLIHTFSALWDPEVARDRAHRVTWTVQPLGRVCRLVLEHDEFDGRTATYHAMRGGSSVILNGMKTLLETGEPLSLGS